MTDDQLLQGIRDKDPAAYDIVFDMLYGRLCSFANGLIKNPVEAKDIVSEGFIKLWVKDKKFNEFSHIEVFLYSIIKNACLDHLKKSKNRRKIENRILPSIDISENAIEAKYLESEIVEKLYLRINKLPERTRQAFTLQYIEGYSRAEVAQMLNISENTVKNMNLSAMKALKLALSNKKLALIIFLIAFEPALI